MVFIWLKSVSRYDSATQPSAGLHESILLELSRATALLISATKKNKVLYHFADTYAEEDDPRNALFKLPKTLKTPRRGLEGQIGLGKTKLVILMSQYQT